MKTHYETLGISPVASLEEIKKRYRELARLHHPDVAAAKGSADQFRLINEAYRILSDSEKRTFYDAELKLAAMKRAESAARQKPKPPPSTASSTSGAHRGGSWQSSGRPSPSKPTPDSAPKKSPVEVYLTQARSAMRKFRYREAESLIRNALRIDRRNPAAYEMLGDIHRARGETEDAISQYSYALQLDRSNQTLREKFDKLVGQPTGPTMSGRAAAAARSPRADSAPHRKKANSRGVINGLGLALVGLMLALTAVSDSHLAAGPIFLEWNPVLLISLAASGWMCGFVLAVNGRLGRFFDELTGLNHGTRVQLGPMVGAFTIVASLVSIYAGFMFYALFGAVQKFHSLSLLCAFTCSLGITVMFAIAAHASGFNVLISGGSVAFLAFLIGWIVGDALR